MGFIFFLPPIPFSPLWAKFADNSFISGAFLRTMQNITGAALSHTTDTHHTNPHSLTHTWVADVLNKVYSCQGEEWWGYVGHTREKQKTRGVAQTALLFSQLGRKQAAGKLKAAKGLL